MTLFTKSHIYNQSLRQAVLACASMGGDAVLFFDSPMNFQIIKYTDGSSTPYLNAEKVLSKSDLKKIEKDKKKEENKKNNKGFLNSNPFLIFLF